MIRNFNKFQSKIKPGGLNLNNIKFEKTILLSFFDQQNNLTEEIEIPYITGFEIYQLIEKNHELILDNCFVSDFSITEFKKLFKHEHSVHVILKNFSAENCIFHNPDSELNFTDIHFTGEKKVNFKNAVFNAKNLTFENCIIDVPEFDLGYAQINTNIFNFTKVKFHNSAFNLKNSTFSEGTKNFSDTEFGTGNTTFINTNFASGDVNFKDCNFGDGKISFKVANFDSGKIDFTNSEFGKGEISFEQAGFGNGDFNFKSVNIQGADVNLTSSSFGTGAKTFTEVNFGNGKIVFKNTNFGNGKISFRKANFGEGEVDFHYCNFGNGDLSFDYAKFKEGGINFTNVVFGTGKVSIKRAYLGDGDIIFQGSTSSGLLTISDSVFGNGEFNFQEAEWEKAELVINNVDFGIGKVSFHKSKFKSLSLQGSQLVNYFDLRVLSCEYLDLSETVVKDIIDINAYDFISKIDNFNISGMRLLGRLYIDWIDNNVKELIYKQNTSNRTKQEQFRILKENYNSIGKYSYEDEAYVEFKRTEARAKLEQDKIKKIPGLGYLSYFSEWVIFDKMGKYATDPLRVLITMVVTYVIFTFLYLILAEFGNIHIISSLFPPGDPRELSTVGKAFYHSAITFLTIGYGDYYPTGASRWISGFEGFVGLFQMSYFTVAFVRKVLR